MTAEEFPPRVSGRLYLTEGGCETEMMYKMGYELPEFASFVLLEDPEARERIRGIWERALDVAAANGMSALLTGVDYRASPDWGDKLGYSRQGLEEVQHRCIEFLEELRDEYADRVPGAIVAGVVGPRGDAYNLDRTITEAEAEDYHSVQLTTIKQTGADMACAYTFNSIPEAVGVMRAAVAVGIPTSMGFTLDSTSRLKSGPSLREAVEAVEAQTGGAPSFYAVNCSHPDEFEPALDGGAWQDRIRVIRPNASRMEKIALCKLGHLEDGDPVELGEQMADVARRFPAMDIFGGCCGTDERHLSEIAKRVVEVRGS